MDDEFLDLEAELKRLRPSAPSPALLSRIECQLRERPAGRTATSAPWFWIAALPAAAAVAVAWTVFFHSPSKSGAGMPAALVTSPTRVVADSPMEMKPIAAENVLVSARDEGLVTLADGTEARRERLHFVDTITWKNPRTNASLVWTVPREEVRVVPISFQ